MASCRGRSCVGARRNRRRGIRQASPRRSAAGHDRDGAPADPEDDRARGLLVRRHLVDRVRDRGDPLRRRGRRLEPRARPQHARPDRRSRSRSCSTIVVTSYRQTIFAYPSGGGSYVVSRENLGENPSLVAGASLLVDYILTVAVSISAGVAAIVSIPAFQDLARAPRRARPRPDRRSSASPTCGASRSRAGSSRSRPTSTSSILGALVGYGLFRSFVLDDIAPHQPDAVRGRRRRTSRRRRSASSSC